MGQYYKGVILNEEKTEVINALNCYAHGNGAKLMEHSYIGNHYVKAYEHLLATTFKGKPFVWCGDYADTDWYSKGWTFDDDKAKDNFYNKYGYNFEGRLMDNEFYPTLPYNKLRWTPFGSIPSSIRRVRWRNSISESPQSPFLLCIQAHGASHPW